MCVSIESTRAGGQKKKKKEEQKKRTYWKITFCSQIDFPSFTSSIKPLRSLLKNETSYAKPSAFCRDFPRSVI